MGIIEVLPYNQNNHPPRHYRICERLPKSSTRCSISSVIRLDMASTSSTILNHARFLLCWSRVLVKRHKLNLKSILLVTITQILLSTESITDLKTYSKLSAADRVLAPSVVNSVVKLSQAQCKTYLSFLENISQSEFPSSLDVVSYIGYRIRATSGLSTTLCDQSVE